MTSAALFHQHNQLILQGIGSIKDYAIFLLDPEGNVMTWNQGAKAIKGYESQEIIGRHFSTFYPQEARNRFFPEYELRIASQQGHFEDEGWRVRKDGSFFWANVIITAIYAEDTTLAGFTKVTRDLTERKQIDEALRQSEQRFRSLVSNVRDYAIFLLDKNGYISTWNEGAKAIKGYDSQEIIGQHFSVFYPSEAVERNFPTYELTVAKQEGRFEDEGWRVRKDGSLFWANVVLTALFDNDHNLTGFTKITKDLTERKRFVDELERAKNKAELMNEELESFAYSVSHDLRAPLRSIDGFTQVLLEDKIDQLDQEAQDYLHRVVRNTQQMNELISGLLTLSRISRVEFSNETVDLSFQTKHILSNLQLEDPTRKVEVIIQESVTSNQSDLVLLRTVLDNLLTNAWKFTSCTENAVIEFGSIDRDGKTAYFVRDNGMGFDMKRADRLFAPFQRLHDPKEYPGNAIGLATVKRIIHKHGGEVWAEATPNEGATFYFTLNS